MKTWFSKYWVLIVLLAIAAVGHAQDKPKVAEASKTVTVKTRKTTKVMKSEGDACCRKDAAKGGATCDTKGGACKDEKCCSSRKGKDSCANGKAECKDSKCCSKDKGSCSSAKGECMDSKSCSMMTHSCPDRPGCESAKGECGMGGGHEMRVMVRTMGDDDGEPGEMGMRRIIRTRIIGGPGMGGEMGGGMMGIADGVGYKNYFSAYAQKILDFLPSLTGISLQNRSAAEVRQIEDALTSLQMTVESLLKSCRETLGE